MTGRIGPRLDALVLDLTRADATAHLPDESDALRPVVATAVVSVTLHTDGATTAQLEAAGLFATVQHLTAVSGQVELADVTRLAAVPGVVEVERSAVRSPTLHTSVPATKADFFRTSTPVRSGAGVVVAVIDSGIDLFHRDFRRADGSSRVIALWDQTSPYTITATGTPTGGTFVLSWQPPGRATQTSTALAFSATAQAVRAALEALDHVEPGDVLVTGGPLPGAPVRVQFAGRYLHRDVEPLVVQTSTLTPNPARMTIERGRRYDSAEVDRKSVV